MRRPIKPDDWTEEIRPRADAAAFACSSRFRLNSRPLPPARLTSVYVVTKTVASVIICVRTEPFERELLFLESKWSRLNCKCNCVCHNDTPLGHRASLVAKIKCTRPYKKHAASQPGACAYCQPVQQTQKRALNSIQPTACPSGPAPNSNQRGDKTKLIDEHWSCATRADRD